MRVFPREDIAKRAVECKPLAPKARATLNGVALTRLTGKYAADDMAYDRDCLLEFAAPASAIRNTGAGAVLRIENDSAAWTLNVPDAFTPRAMTLVSPADGVIRRGREVVVGWSPSTDRIDAPKISFELRGADTELGKGTVISKVDVRRDHLSFIAPNDTPRSSRGPAWLTFLGTSYVRPAHGPCPVGSCSVTLHFSVPPLPVAMEE